MALNTAQIALKHAIRRSRRKDGRLWQIRQQIIVTPATVTAQAVMREELTAIDPVVKVVSEREAQYSGLNMLAGDLKLLLPADQPITMDTVLLCDGQAVDVIQPWEVFQDGAVQHYRCVVRRKLTTEEAAP